MLILSVKYITYTPLWRRQKPDDEYLSLTLPISIIGALLSFNLGVLGFFGWFSEEILYRVDEQPTGTHRLIINAGSLFVTSFVLSFVILFLFYIFTETFRGTSFIRAYAENLDALSETLAIEEELEPLKAQSNARRYLFKELGIVFLFGMIAGVYFVVYYFVLYILLYVFFVLLLINFTSGLPNAILYATILSWFLLATYVINQKLKIEEPRETKIDPRMEYRMTERAVEILASNEPPIICPACRSYIAANSKICSVCREEIKLDT